MRPAIGPEASWQLPMGNAQRRCDCGPTYGALSEGLAFAEMENNSPKPTSCIVICPPEENYYDVLFALPNRPFVRSWTKLPWMAPLRVRAARGGALACDVGGERVPNEAKDGEPLLQ